jgi:transcription elongation factor GreA
MSNRVPMTPEGAVTMRAELRNLKGPERMANIQDIERARAHGDISENAEFEAAKDRQGHIEGRIMELEGKLANADIIDPARLSGTRIVFGATVRVEDLDTGDESEYKIVGEDESDVSAGKISVYSPVARALIGKEEGDSAEVQTPKGVRELDILSVEFK